MEKPISQESDQFIEETHLILKYKADLILQKQKNDTLAETVENNKVCEIGSDTYSMSFKALHFKTIHQQELSPRDVRDAFENTVWVFMIQMLLVGALGYIMTTGHQNWKGIHLPPDTYVKCARVVGAFLMHL